MGMDGLKGVAVADLPLSAEVFEAGALSGAFAPGTARGEAARAFGRDAVADGDDAVADGVQVSALAARSRACGYGCSSGGYGSWALGRNAVVSAGHQYAFVWNASPDAYGSAGDRTFCVNPEGGLSGFYVGGKSLAQSFNGLIARIAELESRLSDVERQIAVAADNA